MTGPDKALIRLAEELADDLISRATTESVAAGQIVKASDGDADTACRLLLLALIRKRPKLASFAFFGATEALREGEG